MSNRGTRWRNGLIAVVLLVAIGGAVWNALAKEKPVSDQGENAVKTGGTQDQERTKQPPASAFGPAGKEKEGPMRGKSVPDLTLPSLDGKTVSLTESDKPAIINLWASWCPPCREEMPYLQKAYEQYGKQVDFRMLNLTSRDHPEKMKAYLKKEKYTFPVLLDETGEAQEAFGVINIPQTFVVDKEGQIIYHHSGSLSKKQIDRIMKEITS
ncbi:TlpA family protein disulfide reductase [Salinithrix halophila]|uniref:TlpA family protein disulfide reductase n=1 Tax=Salinithrix halophila TaxID=1485204 RepID=A0ABV8JDM5_9BACL